MSESSSLVRLYGTLVLTDYIFRMITLVSKVDNTSRLLKRCSNDFFQNVAKEAYPLSIDRVQTFRLI